MPLLNFLYYKETSSGVSYTYTPTGNLDVSRLVNGQAYWIKPSPPQKQKPKKLIFADWSVKNWLPFLGVFNRLLEQGFSLYVWSSRKILPLTQENLDNLKELKRFLSHITFDYPAEIIDAAAKQRHLTKSEILIVDSHWMRCLCKQDETLPRRVKHEEFINLNAADTEKLIDILQHAQPPIEEIVYEVYPPSEILPDLTQLFSQAQIKKEYKVLCVTGELKFFTSSEVWQQGVTVQHFKLFQPINALAQPCINSQNLNLFSMIINTMPNLKKIKSLDIAIKNFTYDLLHQFIKSNPHCYRELLQKSLEVLTPLEKHELITQLYAFAISEQKNLGLVKILSELIRNISNKAYYECRLKTLHTKRPTITTVSEYCQKSLQPGDNNKRLIKLNSTEEVDGIAYALQQQAKKTQRPLFYIGKPDDLICSASSINLNQDQTGQLCKGPSGALYQFLQLYQQRAAPILLVNYERFTPEDLVRFNNLLNKKRSADGALLPEDTVVIGLINVQNPDCYQGSDFYSRFTSTEHCPFSAVSLNPMLPLINSSPDSTTTRYVINLYHAVDWENRLLGRWVLNRNQQIYEEGELEKSLKTGLPIEICNGRWDDEDFVRFWQQIRLGGVRYQKGLLQIPVTTLLIRSEGYDWLTLGTVLELTAPLSSEVTQILNSGNLHDFFSHYHYHDIDASLENRPGLIQDAKNKGYLAVYVTSTLDEDAWAQLLTECQKQGIRLIAHYAPGVCLPKALGMTARLIPVIPPVQWSSDNLQIINQIIISTDINTTLHQLTQGTSEWQVSPEIRTKLEPFLATESLSQLHARAAFLKRHPNRSSDLAWEGMHDLSSSIPLLDLEEGPQAAKNFMQARLEAINTVLSEEPFVFITGLSGVGKSTFVEKELCEPEDGLYIGENRISTWARAQDSKRSILFLDEANLSHRSWSEFEGLFHNPPAILVDGVLYPLTARHKVVFAGNLVNYGDERHLAPFFQRHGNAVVFNPLSYAVIAEKIIKPVFYNQDVSLINLKIINHHLLTIYHFLCSHSKTDILISPRELQMMALLILLELKKNSQVNLENIAKQVVYESAQNLVPPAAKHKFNVLFKSGLVSKEGVVNPSF